LGWRDRTGSPNGASDVQVHGVLYPATLRSLLVYLAIEDVFRVRWTDRIHDEWTRNVLANHPDIRLEQLRRTRSLMDAHVPNGLVVGTRN
jgi:hypothetical protein